MRKLRVTEYTTCNPAKYGFNIFQPHRITDRPGGWMVVQFAESFPFNKVAHKYFDTKISAEKWIESHGGWTEANMLFHGPHMGLVSTLRSLVNQKTQAKFREDDPETPDNEWAWESKMMKKNDCRMW